MASQGDGDDLATEATEVIDIDGLLVLVEACPELYDYKRKDHHNQDVIAKCWQSIGKELNIAGSVCKSKWHTLRSSYGRYLRELKKMPSGSTAKKKKWYLADAMNFLLPYMGPQNKTSSNMKLKSTEKPKEKDEDEIVINAADNENITPEADEGDGIVADLGITSSATNSVGDIEEINPKKKKAKTAAEVVAEPMAAYFKSITNKKQTEDHPVLLVFKGLMPDVEKLSQASQRKLKSDIVNMVNYYTDLEERGETPLYNYFGPPQNNSVTASHSIGQTDFCLHGQQNARDDTSSIYNSRPPSTSSSISNTQSLYNSRPPSTSSSISNTQSLYNSRPPSTSSSISNTQSLYNSRPPSTSSSIQSPIALQQV